MSDPTTPEGRVELRKLHAAAVTGKWIVGVETSMSPGCHYFGDSNPDGGEPVGDAWKPAAELIVAAVNALPALLDALDETQQAPCAMTHTPPFDFAQCETHDETFPLGETCRFHERDMVEVLFEAADEQRMRAVRAEHELGLARERLRALTYASDDGTEYEHTHPANEGEPECPACWAADIRRTLDGTS